VWGSYVAKEGWLEQGDLEEAINAANQIGDDTIQKRTQGYVVPDAFNHGTAEQRRYWVIMARQGVEIPLLENLGIKPKKDVVDEAKQKGVEKRSAKTSRRASRAAKQANAKAEADPAKGEADEDRPA
jgi:hypothetical protein